MNTKSILNKAKAKLSLVFTTWGTCIATQRSFHAATTQTEIGAGIDTAATNFVSEIAAVYCGSLFFLLLVINALTLLLSKNEKVTGVAKKTLIGVIVAYIVLKLAQVGWSGKLGTTVDTMSGWITN